NGPGFTSAEEYVRTEANGTPNEDIDRSRSRRENAPVAVFTPMLRTAWPASVMPNAFPQLHPAACAPLIGGGTIVVRGFTRFDSADTTSRPSANVAVMVTKYSFAGSRTQPCAAPNDLQYLRTVSHGGSSSAGVNVVDACSVPAAASN